jgi:hypothetical protein
MLEQHVWVAYFPGAITKADFGMKETFLMTACSISQIVSYTSPRPP